MIKRTGEQTYEVESLNPKNAGTWYKVDLEKNECSCPAWQHGGRRPCKHISMVNNALAKEKSEVAKLEAEKFDGTKQEGGSNEVKTS